MTELRARLPRCVRCGAQAIYDAPAGRWVHEDPAVSLAVDHAAHVITPERRNTSMAPPEINARPEQSPD